MKKEKMGIVQYQEENLKNMLHDIEIYHHQVESGRIRNNWNMKLAKTSPEYSC